MTSKAKFKAGDRVRIKGDQSGVLLYQSWHPSNLWVVQIDGRTYCEENTGTLINECDLELETSE